MNYTVIGAIPDLIRTTTFILNHQITYLFYILKLTYPTTSGTIVLGRLIGSSLVESFTNSYTLTDPNGTEEKYT